MIKIILHIYNRMKSIGLKEANYSLHNLDNYKKEFSVEIDEILIKYSELLIEYYKFILENIKIKNKGLSRFIIIRGLDTISNVFLNILLYTKNIDITNFHCQKSFYFYVEFVGQISEDEKMFLQLTSRDASTYVYKKTIFEIKNEFKKLNEHMNDVTREKMSIINTYVNIYKTFIYKLVQNETYNIDNNIDYFEKISNKLNKLNILNKENIQILESVVDKLYNNVSDVKLFFEINSLLVKKFLKNPEIIKNCEKKVFTQEFSDKLNDPIDKFINWFVN